MTRTKRPGPRAALLEAIDYPEQLVESLPPETTLAHYAVHEAGHAVAADFLGGRVFHVSLAPPEPPFTDAGFPSGIDDELDRWAAFCFAGIVAQLARFRMCTPGNFQNDLAELHRQTKRLGLPVPDHRQSARDAVYVLRDCWPAVLRVGDALLERGRLTGEEAVRIANLRGVH